VIGQAADIPYRFLFYHSDHLGSPRLILTSNGDVETKHHYLPFGDEYENVADSTLNSRGFTGHEQDPESGLDYMLARYYSSTLGRFMAVDPGDDTDLEDPQSWNKYAYVRNNPVGHDDPNGKELVAALAGAGIGFVVGAAIEVVHEYRAGESLVPQKIGAAGAGGAVTGAITGLTNGASLLVEAAVGGVAGVAGGATERALDGDLSTNPLSGTEAAKDFAFGAAGNALGKVAGDATESAVKGTAAEKVNARMADSKVRSAAGRSPSRRAAARAVADKMTALPRQAGEAAKEAVGAAADAANQATDKKDKK
jgi:RHS repeat-associated protein